MKFLSDITFKNAIDDCLVCIRQRIVRYKKAKTIINEVIQIKNNNND